MLAQANNSRAMATALLYLMVNPAEAREMGKTAHTLVRSKFTITAMKQKVKEIISTLEY